MYDKLVMTIPKIVMCMFPEYMVTGTIDFNGMTYMIAKVDKVDKGYEIELTLHLAIAVK